MKSQLLTFIFFLFLFGCSSPYDSFTETGYCKVGADRVYTYVVPTDTPTELLEAHAKTAMHTDGYTTQVYYYHNQGLQISNCTKLSDAFGWITDAKVQPIGQGTINPAGVSNYKDLQ